LCQPASGGTIKVCSKNNSCVACSGTNPCPVDSAAFTSGNSAQFQCTSGNDGGCARTCTTQADCAFVGLKCYSDSGKCDLSRAVRRLFLTLEHGYP
jgi:hypothetical protein